jgi:cytidine deaminase
MLLETVSGIRTIDEVLPDAFGPRQLAEYHGGTHE